MGKDEAKDEQEEELPEGPVENAWDLKLPEFKKGDMKHRLQEESTFSLMFPRYREEYIKECWPLILKTMKEYSIKAELDLIKGTMQVSTTKSTWDPYAILKARDIIKLLARCVPVEQAVRVLEDGITQEIINIGNMVSSNSRLINRRKRLVGTNGTTLKALELLTDCYILIQGRTVAAIGPYQGVLQVMNVVKKTVQDNVHPVYSLKILMIKRQLAADPNLKDENWDRFLPSFKAKNVKTKKPKFKKKKPYTPFPPERTERKVDMEVAEGKYFIEKGQRKDKPKEEGQKAGPTRREIRRAKGYEAPIEPDYQPHSSKRGADVDISSLKKKFKGMKKKSKAVSG